MVLQNLVYQFFFKVKLKNLLKHNASNMYGSDLSHLKSMLLCVSIIIKFSNMRYTNSNDISMMLSEIFLNGLTTPRYVKYKNWNTNNNMTASILSFCPKNIANTINMYFLTKLTNRNNLDMVSLAYGHTLFNINIYYWLTCSCLIWYHWRTQHW